MPVRVAKPKEMEGLFETLRDPGYSTAIGLVLYGAGHFTPYEIDSNKKLRYKDEAIAPSVGMQGILDGNDSEELSIDDSGIESAKDKLANMQINNKDSGDGLFTKVWNRMTQLF